MRQILESTTSSSIIIHIKHTTDNLYNQEMSFDFSSISPTANTIATSAYLDFLPSLQYLKSLGSSRFLKTNQCLSVNGYVVVKLLVKPATVEINMKPYLENLNQLKEKLKNIPKTLPYYALIDSERATYLIRPYGRYSLFERLSIRPFFESIEKRWIVYQMLYTLARMHEVSVCHGDLKTENILLTSWNWIMISDIGLFKPVYLPDHNQSQFSFYFDTSQRHSCYIAPERFKTQEEINKLDPKQIKLDPKSDIFSLGCVIAELYNDGVPIFSLPQMFKYRKHDYVPNLDAIEDSNIRKLVQSMIHLDPQHRLAAKEYLANYRKILFPDHFYTFLYTYMKNMSDPSLNKSESSLNFQICDYRIDKMYKDFDKIALYFGFKKNIIETDEMNSKTDITDSIIPPKLNLPGMKRHIPQSTFKIIRPDSTNDSPCLILLTLLCHTTRNTAHSIYRVKACELILAFAEQLHDEAKLDRCLPYLINMLDDPSENVQVAALVCMTQLLTMVDTVTPINIHLFQEYVIPKLQSFLKRSYIYLDKDSGVLNNSKYSEQGNTDDQHSYNPGSYVRTIFASCLPHLAVTARKFYDTALLLQSNVIKYNGTDADSILFGDATKNALEFDDIVNHFENLTVQILTDPNVYVKIALMKKIDLLCSFFGKEKTNDVILSHLITYLNDKNSQLKLAFISCIVSLAIFVGDVSLEQYILPLLIPAVNNPEELIVSSLLKVFSQLTMLGLLKKECFKDLLNICVVLILHPTSLIRQSVLNLIITIGKQLSTADFYCMLYPLVRPFFQQELINFNWKSLYIAAHEPIPKVVYEELKKWSLTSQETLFWQRVQSGDPKQNIDSFGNAKVSFLRKQNRNVAADKNTVYQQSNILMKDFVSNYEIPLSNSDIKYINKIKMLGLDPEDLWKLATMRGYVYAVVRIQMRLSSYSENFKGAISPRSVFADVVYSYDNLSTTIDKLKADDNVKQKVNSNIVNSKTTVGPLILKNLETLQPVLTTSDKIAFSAVSMLNTSVNDQNQMFQNIEGFNVFDETMQLRRFNTNVTFSYPGKNPYILKFLKSIPFDATINDYPEFGERVDILNTAKSKSEATVKNLLITRLVEHKAPIVSVVASPDSSFFVSVDSSGFLKIWDTQRLEVDIIGESSLSVKFDSKITSICFMKDRYCFAVAKQDGTIDIFRVDFVSSSEAETAFQKFTTISRIRHLRVASKHKYATKLEMCSTFESSNLYFITATSELIGVDIKDMSAKFTYHCDILQGYAKCFVVDNNERWALIGTNRGIINLIGLQSCMCIKSTKFTVGHYSIKEIIKIDEDAGGTKVCIIGGTGRSEIILWDVSKSHPTTVLSSEYNDIASVAEKYTVKDMTDKLEEAFAIITDLKDSFDNDKSCTSVCYHHSISTPGTIVTATKDRKVIQWEIKNFEDSRVVMSPLSSSDDTIFTQKLINSGLSFVQEQPSKHKLSKESETAAMAVNSKAPLDIVTSITMLALPYPMIVCGDRTGSINVYS